MMMKKYNLDKPLFEQYKIYMTDLVHGDLGESIVRSGREVSRFDDTQIGEGLQGTVLR